MDATVEQTVETQPQTTSPSVSEVNTPNVSSNQQAAVQALLELDKHENFKWKGQDWKLSDLEKSIMLHKDYTKKTQALSADKKTFEEKSKYQENLAFDLWYLREDPSQLELFLKHYPKEYHQYAKMVLEMDSQKKDQPAEQKPKQDVELLSRLNNLEKRFTEQDVQKDELFVQSQLDKIPKMYPPQFQKTIQEIVMARVYTAKSQGANVTEDVWADTIKSVGDEVTGLVKAQYGDLVNKQTKANKKGADVESGGGTPGSAPKKFKSIDDIANSAIKEFSQG